MQKHRTLSEKKNSIKVFQNWNWAAKIYNLILIPPSLSSCINLNPYPILQPKLNLPPGTLSLLTTPPQLVSVSWILKMDFDSLDLRIFGIFSYAKSLLEFLDSLDNTVRIYFPVGLRANLSCLIQGIINCKLFSFL